MAWLKKPFFLCLLWGFLLAAAQTAWVCALAKGELGLAGYPQLCTWDSGWFSNILEHGYISTIPPVKQRGDLANVGFFPAYPILARWIGLVLGTDSCHSLLVTAQLSAWAFWAYVLLFLRLWSATALISVCVIGALLLYPASFYIVVGYSEGLFMATLLGFLYWAARSSQQDNWGSKAWLSAAHGFVLTATRLVGIPVAFAPALQALLARPAGLKPWRPAWGRLKSAVLLGALASLGAFAFFAFCRIKFGHWDLYMQTLRIGWDVTSDFSAIYNPASYPLSWDLLKRTLAGDVWALGSISVTLTLWQFVLMIALEAGAVLRGLSQSRWRERIAFYAGAGGMFYLSVCGRFTLGMMGMIRYNFPVFALLALAAAHFLLDPAKEPGRAQLRKSRTVAVAAGVLLVLALTSFYFAQRLLAYKHTHWEWAA